MSEPLTDWSRGFFKGRQVLVTGGSSGIGLALAQGFAAAGASVVATAATEPELRAAPEGERIAYAELDVRDEAAIAALAGRLERLDVLVNCAGVNLQRAEFEIETFESVVDVNLTGVMRMCVACRELLADGGGAILNIASMFAFHGAGHAPAYASSKGGVAQLTKSLAIAWVDAGIRVNALAPGWIETAMTEPARADKARNEAILARTPLRRWGKPTDLVGPALFLTSPLAEFVTGAILPVDGGYLAL